MILPLTSVSSSTPTTTTASTSTSAAKSAAALDVSSLIPRCARCTLPFDTYSRMCFTLVPCTHTFCKSCINRMTKSKRLPRRCVICQAKYATSQVNLPILNLVIRVASLVAGAASCNECLQLFPPRFLRRCATCEEEVFKKTAISKVSCVVCLECVLENHRNHQLHKCQNAASNTSAKSSPTVSSAETSSPDSAKFENTSSERTQSSMASASCDSSKSAKQRPKSFLGKVRFVPGKIAANFANFFAPLKENPSLFWKFVAGGCDKSNFEKSGMNSKYNLNPFNATPKSRCQKTREHEENFWWKVGQQAAQAQPFIFGCALKDDKKFQRDALHQSKLNRKERKPNCTTTNSFRLLASDLLMKPNQHKHAYDSGEAKRNSCQHFYSNAEFFKYVNLLNAEEFDPKDFGNFIASSGSLSSDDFVELRSRRKYSSATIRKCSAPPRVQQRCNFVPANYSNIV